MGMHRGTMRWEEEKLDRALVNSKWSKLFPKAYALNEDMVFVDHSTIILVLGERKQWGQRKFRFENAWTREP